MLPRLKRSTVEYEGRAFSVRRDEMEYKPGRTVKLDIIVHPHAVTILPLDAGGNVWFIRQYRHPASDSLLELPAGTLEPGEDAADAANRELQEEIGMRAETLALLSTFWLAPGYSTELMHVYLATGLSASQLEQDEDEVISLEKVPAGRAAALIDSGELRDAKSIAAVLLAARKLGW